MTPDGTTWRIRRRWAPKLARHAGERVGRHLRRMRFAGDAADAAPLVDELVPALVLVLLLLFAIGIVVTGLPLLVDLVLLVLGFVGGVVARVVFRRPWTVEAVSGGRTIERRVVGWRKAGEMVDQLAHEATHGQLR